MSYELKARECPMGRISPCSSTLRARVSECDVFLLNLLTVDDVCVVAELSVRPDLIRQLVPPHCEPELASRGVVLDKFVPIPLEQLKITLD